MAIQIASLFASIGADTSGLQRGLKDAETQISKTAQGIEKSGESFNFAAMATGFNQALEIVNKLGDAISKAYAAAKEGAELDYARSKFDNLAESIGAVSGALLDDLRNATSGMMSDAELVAGAGDLMALGLAKSHDEVVRLTSVAGALGMNMNQLVLTLTNQTTMRFDALGVSVDGFQEKVKALEAAGMSANDAFKEAFLQQTEEQIGKVGSAADQAIGSFNRLEAAAANFSNSLKSDLSPVAAKAADGMAELIENLTPTDLSRFPEFVSTLSNAFNEGAIDIDIYNETLRDVKNGFTSIPDGIRAVNTALEEHRAASIASSEANQNSLIALFNSTNSWEEFQVAAQNAGLDLVMLTEEIYNSEKANVGLAEETQAAAVEAMLASGDYEGLAAAIGVTTDEAKAMTKAWQESEEAHAKMMAELESITTLDRNYKGIINLAYKYTDILADITEQETIMANNPIGSEKYEEAKGKVEALKGSMADLANRVTLDMFQATIAIGGVTAAELSAYTQMAVDMGVMSKEGAQAAIDAYGKAIETINGYKIDEKTGNVSVDAVSAFATLDLLQQYSLLDKEQRVFVTTYYGTSHGYDPYNDIAGGSNAPQFAHAMGGYELAGQPYLVGEAGPELFIPDTNGRVYSNSSSSAMLGGGNGDLLAALGRLPTASDIALAVRDALLMVGA